MAGADTPATHNACEANKGSQMHGYTAKVTREPSQCVPEQNHCVPEQNQCVPDRTQCVPEQTQCLPEQTQCVPKQTQCVPDQTQCLRPLSLSSVSIVHYICILGYLAHPIHSFGFLREVSYLKPNRSIETLTLVWPLVWS